MSADAEHAGASSAPEFDVTALLGTDGRALHVTSCNQCEEAPRVAACPTSATYRRPDGIVDFDAGVEREPARV